MIEEQKLKIKADNEKAISLKGYRVNDWLPVLDTTSLRTLEEVKGRMSVMNALINIAFEAPVYIIKEWIEKQQLSQYLSGKEKEILAKKNDELADTELNSLRWYLESLWALMWTAGMIDDLDAEKHVGDNQAFLLPNLEQGENNSKIDNLQSLRSETEIYTMLDYYFRLHWYCVDERLNGRKATLYESQIYERRKALEWIFNRAENWDEVEMNT